MLTAGAEDDVRLEELALVVALDAHEVGAVVHAPALVARYRRCNEERRRLTHLQSNKFKTKI